MKFEEFIKCFDGVKRLNANSVKAICPCHNDKQASLGISAKGGKILINCLAVQLQGHTGRYRT